LKSLSVFTQFYKETIIVCFFEYARLLDQIFINQSLRILNAIL
jgi:hypothetical protein